VINHQYKVIFIKQRKAASESIKAAFGVKRGSQEWRAYTDGVLDPNWSARDPSYFVFAVVRNPFDRLISSWKYLPAYRKKNLAEVLKNPPMEGHDFRHLTRPQIAILKDPATGKLVVDDLIRFEALQEDFDRICDKVGKPRVQLPHKNWSWRWSGYQSYFDDGTRKLATEMFAEDLEVFGYRF
jgi:hypothetical protein